MGLRFALVAAVWVVGGCSAAGGGSGSLRPASEQPSAVPAASSGGSPGTIDLPASVIDPVVADVARLAGVPIDQVTVLSAESVTFPDGGLGCPLPGMAYPQVQVEGYKIVAEAGGTTYDYRGTTSGFRRCVPG
jgi:hypothetical protein